MKVAIVGVGNCASAFSQALYAIRRGLLKHTPLAPGLDNIDPAEINIVAAFDVDRRKVGQPFKDAIFAPPNCTSLYFRPDEFDFPVHPGALLDGVEGPLAQEVPLAPNAADMTKKEIRKYLEAAGADIVVVYLPVGAQRAADFYADVALAAGCGLVNNTPAMIARSPALRSRFSEAGLPLVGDDMKSHIGSTTIHQHLLKLLSQRGIKVTSTYQLNVGGNTDFLNMRDLARSNSKRETKRAALAEFEQESLGVGPSDYIPHLKDYKVGYINIEGSGYMGMPFAMELRLKVEDSPNSAAVAIDAVRLAEHLRRNPNESMANSFYALFKAPGRTA